MVVRIQLKTQVDIQNQHEYQIIAIFLNLVNQAFIFIFKMYTLVGVLTFYEAILLEGVALALLEV